MPQNDIFAGLDFSSVTGACASAVIDINGVTGRLLGGKTVARKPFRMAAKDGVGEIFIFDDIGEGFFSDGITPKSFAADLKALGAVRTLNIFINSPGGAVFDGVAIFNQLKRHPARKNVFIDGIAASIASVIAMAGDEINIAANGFIMIHEPFAGLNGTASEHRKIGENLDKINDTIINTYAARTGTPENVIGDLMAAETWMNAEEAVELGFADNITDEVAVAAMFDLSQFQNVPEEAAAKLDLAKNPPAAGFAHGCLVGKRGPELFAPEPEGTMATVEPEAPEDDPDDPPRAPSLAVTKMRQRIQKRGLVPRAGPRLASELNQLIDDRVTEDRSRADIIEDMAREAGISTSTVNNILTGNIDCPPEERLAGFARALETSLSRIITAAEADGCDYGTDEEDSNRNCVIRNKYLAVHA